ncbi:unnamed protein product [Owenia fusiformis]|uniref:type I protein arginine methyltransferase n=1 Tax=Owenia fusiformis TaxID=6347 RepID=A0A8J1XIA5_OWEFU|nr:unnamed protein product [Owenia fusiformis]
MAAIDVTQGQASIVSNNISETESKSKKVDGKYDDDLHGLGQYDKICEKISCLKSNDDQHIQSSLIDLPWEDVVFRHILPRLRMSSIFKLRTTSRDYLEMVDGFLINMRTLDLSKDLKFNKRAFELVTKGNSSLRKLILKNTKDWLTDSVLVAVIMNNSRLLTIDLTSCTCITNASLIRIGNSCRNLEQLYLRDCCWITTSGLNAIAMNCPNLTKLDIKGCWNLSDEDVQMIVMMCGKLTFISLARIYGLTDNAVKKMAHMCPGLSIVNMQGCWRVSNDGIMELAEYSKKLKYVMVKECRDITESSLGKLRSRGVVDDPMSSDSDGNEEEWEPCEEEQPDSQPPTRCLFCSQMLDTPENVLSHCKKDHKFDIAHIQRIHGLDCFGYIKMVNYIRKMHPSPEEVASVSGKACWDSDEYMSPTDPEDLMLQLDIEDEIDLEAMTIDSGNMAMSSDIKTANGHCDYDDITLSRSEYNALIGRLREADSKAKLAQDQLESTMKDLSTIKSVANGFLTSKSSNESPATHDAVRHLKDGDDGSYVDGYSHFGIHQEMLQDRIRTESYRDFIYANKELFKGKVVLDIGCGTGILSMFAAKAGASKVIGIDMSDIIYPAMDIVRENKLDDIITLVKGRVEDVTIPVDKVDIIISEWMGYFLLFESMLDTVLYARDRWLHPGGIICPSHCSLNLLGVSDPDLYQRNIGYWSDVYGFKMSCLRGDILQEAVEIIVRSDKIATQPCTIKEIDIHTCSTKELDFVSPIKLTALTDTTIYSIAGYFDITFAAQQPHSKVEFSTSPKSTPTHWKQTVFHLHTPVTLAKGESLEGKIVCKKNPKDPRSLVIKLTYGGSTYTYHMR